MPSKEVEKIDYSEIAKDHPVHNWHPVGLVHQNLGSAVYCKGEPRRGRWFAGCYKLRWIKKRELEEARIAWREYMDRAIPA